jgi:hypothetical protein
MEKQDLGGEGDVQNHERGIVWMWHGWQGERKWEAYECK